MASHSLRVLSSLPETMIRPSREKATDLTGWLWHLRLLTSSPLAASQSQRLLSQPPDTMKRPSGEKATEFTVP